MEKDKTHETSTAVDFLSHSVNVAHFTETCMNALKRYFKDYRRKALDLNMPLEELVQASLTEELAALVTFAKLKIELNQGTFKMEELGLYAVNFGQAFLFAHPHFSMHEFVQQGASLTAKEQKHLLEELKDLLNDDETSPDVLTRLAAIGYTLFNDTVNGSEKKKIEQDIAEGYKQLVPFLKIDYMEASLMKEKQELIKSLNLAEKLQSVMGIKILKDGSIHPEDGDYEKMNKKLGELTNIKLSE